MYLKNILSEWPRGKSYIGQTDPGRMLIGAKMN